MGGGGWLQRGRLRTVAGTGRHDHLALHDESFNLLQDSVLIAAARAEGAALDHRR